MIEELFPATVGDGVRRAAAPLGKRSQPAPEKTSRARCDSTIIEMFGVPGAGKSTVASAAVKGGYPHTRTELTEAWTRLSIGQKIAFLLRALINVPCLVRAARFAFRTRLTSSESLVRLVRLIAKTHWMRSQPNHMLLDQSFLQEIWSICIAGGRTDPDQVALIPFIRSLYAGLETHIVFVDTDEATASQRIAGRGHGFSRLDGLAIAEVEARLARTARLPQILIAAATAAGLPVERLDGSQPVEANAERLLSLVARSCGPAAPKLPTKLHSLTQQTLSAFFWQSGVAASTLVIRAIILIVLARHLPPGDFGIVAAAMVVSNMTLVVTQIGVAKALVQRPVLLEQHVRSGFLVTVLMGAVATVMLAVGAPLFAAPFKLEGLEPVIRFLSVLLLLNGITAVPMALIHRARKFRTSSGIEFLSFLFGYGGVGMFLALAGFGVWSLAVAEVSHAGSRMLLYMFVARPPLGLRWDRTALKQLFEVGSGYSAGQIGNLLATQVDYLIVGRLLGATALGLYSRAYQFLMLPAQLIGTATQTVLFPSIASIQDQPDRVARAFLRATGVIALTTLPISGVLMILGPELVNITLGPRWQGMIVPFQILIATLLFRTSYKISDSVSLALGSMVQRAWRQWIYAGAVTAGAVLGARWGLPGVSAGVGAAVALNFLMMLQLAMRVTGVSAYRMLATHVSHALAAVPIVFAVWASVSLARKDGLDDLLVLALGLGTAALMAGLLWWKCRWIFGADGVWAHGVAAARLAPLQAKFRA